MLHNNLDAADCYATLIYLQMDRQPLIQTVSWPPTHTMRYVELAKQLWPKAKSILLPWDGSATEVFITSLGNDALPHSIEVIQNFVNNPEITCIADENIETPVPLTSVALKKLNVDSDNLIQHTIRGSFVKANDICFYIWVDGQNQSHDVEMVFWNDLHFPKTVSDEQHITTWERIVIFTEQIREGTLNSKCILTPEHNGPVEELFDHKSIVVW
ncbi:MAG: hypothetical protein AAFN42_08265 [Cyanobacteria bacterium J06554_1]